MWEHLQLYAPLACIAQAFHDGTAVCVTDGSYQRHVNPTLSGAGWLLYCAATDQILVTDSFVEDHVKAGSYSGEVLGMLVIDLFSLATKHHFSITSAWFGTICCNSKGVIYWARQWKKHIAPGIANVDLLQVLSSLHHRLGNLFSYEHVYGQQDQFQRGEDLPLTAQLNCRCDQLTKQAVQWNWNSCHRNWPQYLWARSNKPQTLKTTYALKPG